IQNFAQSFLEQKDIALNFSNDMQNLQKTLKIDFRQNIMLIAKEAINNAVKYSDCSKIDIVMNYKNDKFELLISDNGKGFDMQSVKKGNGLKNMKMRAKSIGAEINFKNEDGFLISLTKTKL
ncbi:MAG: ATP-binding protein, partial [Ignavibacteriae bacterium]|nr:ATP-binding protein [Ignavibacteriota bacterium]